MKKLTKKELIIGYILATLLLLTTLSSTWFFLSELKVTVLEWSVFNACAPSSFVYLICFVLFMVKKNYTALSVAIIPMFFFGTMGLFVFSWDGQNLFAQISHIIMTLNICWSIYILFKKNDFKAIAIGLMIGVFLFIPYISFTQHYCRIHAEKVEQILQMK